MADTSWVDLLADSSRLNKPILVSGLTPQRDTQVLRCQVAALLRDKRRLTEDAVKSRDCQADLERQVQELHTQLSESRSQGEEVCLVLEEQSKLISELSQFKAECESNSQETIRVLQERLNEKDRALQGVYAHVQELRSEVSKLSSRMNSSQPQERLVQDMERLTLRNAEISESLVATQHARTLLEKELVTLKRRLVDEKSHTHELELQLQDQTDLNVLKESLSIKDMQLSHALQELDQLKQAQVSSIDKKCHQVDLLKAQIQTQLSLEQQEKVHLEGRLAVEQQEKVHLEGRLVVEQQEKVHLEGRLAVEQQEKVHLEGRLAVEQQEKVHLEGRLAVEQQEKVHLEGRLMAEQQEKVHLEGRLAAEQQSRASLKEDLVQKLTKSTELCNDLTCERDMLLERGMHQDQHCQAQNALIEKVKGQLEGTCSELQLLSNQLEATKTDKMILEQQVSDLEGQLSSLRGQLVSRQQLTDELKALLDQKTARVKHLERSLDRLREERSIDNVGDLLNASRESLGSQISVCSSTQSVRRSPARFSTAQAEISHLKQRLADSRQVSIRLEMQCAQLKTETARLLGSQQALLTIKEQLVAKNSSLDRGQRLFKETWEKEKIDMSTHITSLCNELNKTRELVSVRESTHLNQVKQQVLSLQKERDHVTAELSHVTSQRDHVTAELSHVTALVHSESIVLLSTTRVLSLDLEGLRTEQLRIKDQVLLAEAINNKRRTQIQERESGLLHLLGELEMLRARKRVLSNSVSEDRGQRSQRALKQERQQANFVRLRLGYVLRELKLYKELKVAMETKMCEMENGLEDLQHQHFLCVQKLRQAEQLGFTPQ